MVNIKITIPKKEKRQTKNISMAFDCVLYNQNNQENYVGKNESINNRKVTASRTVRREKTTRIDSGSLLSVELSSTCLMNSGCIFHPHHPTTERPSKPTDIIVKGAQNEHTFTAIMRHIYLDQRIFRWMELNGTRQQRKLMANN